MVKLNATDKKKSRKDLKLHLGPLPGLQKKPPLPIKRFQMMNPAAAKITTKHFNSKNLPANLKVAYVNKQQKQIIIEQQHVKKTPANNNNVGLPKEEEELHQQRKTPRVLNNPQYACFLQATTPNATKPIQRSRSNEFQKTFNTFSISTTVSRSTSLRNLEHIPSGNVTSSQFSQSPAIGGTSSYGFSAEVNSNNYRNKLFLKNEIAKDPRNALENPSISQCVNNNANENPSNSKNTIEPNNDLEIEQNNQCSSDESNNERSQSLNNLVVNTQISLNLEDILSKSVDNLSFKQNAGELKSLKNLHDSAELYVKSVENLNSFSCKEHIKYTSANEIEKTISSAKAAGNSPSIKSSVDPIYTATLDYGVNDMKATPVTLTKGDGDNRQNLRDCGADFPKCQKPEHNLSLIRASENLASENENLFLTQTEYHNSLDLNCKKSLNDSNAYAFDLENSYNDSSDSSKKTTESAVGRISLTVNSKYVTDYRSKITENLSRREFKSEEILTSQNTSSDPLISKDLIPESLSLPTFNNSAESLLNKKPKSLKVVDHMNTQSISDKKENSISNKHFSDIIEYSLYRTIKPLNYTSNITESLNEKLTSNNVVNNSYKNLRDNLPQPLNEINTFDNIDSEVGCNEIYTVDNIDSEVGCTDSTSENLSKCQDKSLENKRHTESNLKVNLIDNLSEIVDDHNTENLGTFEDSASNTNIIKSLQMSRDSLDDYEDAQEINEGKLLTELEATEILADIAIGLDPFSSFDFNNLLTLKKSKTSYCLHSLEKSTSLESKDDNKSLQSDEDNFLSACNTLESKCSLKPREAVITKTESLDTSEMKPPHLPPKKPKNLRIKTTEKILNLTNMATQNVATYATFRKSKNFYKNASKSFKNSLRFYESFSAKTAPNTMIAQPPLKRSASLTENPAKKAELNRKIFSKSSKIMTKVRNMEEWDSPTENSYSFEYFDAESDLNGNLINMGSGTLNSLIEIKHNSSDNFDIEKNESNLSGTQEAKKVSRFLSANEETLLSEKCINLKPISMDFYFNNSPRPFKRIYQATTNVVDIEKSADELSDSENVGESRRENFQQSSSKSSVTEGITNDYNTDKPQNYSIPTADNFQYLNEIFPKTSNPIVVKSTTISQLSAPAVLNYLPLQRAKSFTTTFDNKPDLISSFQKSGSFNTFSKNIIEKEATFNKNIKQDNKLEKCDNSKKPKEFVILNVNSPLDGKSKPKIESFMRNDDCSAFSFNLAKFSGNSPKSSDSSPINTANSSPISKALLKKSSFPENGAYLKGKLTKTLPKSTAATLIDNFNVKRSPHNTTYSSNSIKLTEFDQQHNNFNVALATTNTLTVNDKTTATTNPNTITPTTTNFPTKVVAIKNAKSSHTSYSNSSCSLSSSVRTANKSYATAKHHQNQKVTTIATTATTKKTSFTPAPTFKSTASKSPPKVFSRRLFVNAPKTAKTKTTTTTATSTRDTTTTSSTYFKASSTCTSANNNVVPLRRRIPGNTLYYV